MSGVVKLESCSETPQTPAARRRSHAAGGWRDREEFKARVLEWARKLEVDAHSIYIRPMSRKWASCSTAGTLSFNDELLSLEQDLGDYVIVHELLHFSVPNHGKLWKSLMRAHLGDYETIEGRLKTRTALERAARS
jgi:predicted metal-dependent hydrolase